MTGALKDQAVLVVGRGGGLAHAVVRAALDADAHDEDSIAALGQRLGSGDFEGGRSGAVRVLGKLGFTVQAR